MRSVCATNPVVHSAANCAKGLKNLLRSPVSTKSTVAALSSECERGRTLKKSPTPTRLVPRVENYFATFAFRMCFAFLLRRVEA